MDRGKESTHYKNIISYRKPSKEMGRGANEDKLEFSVTIVISYSNR